MNCIDFGKKEFLYKDNGKNDK